MAFQFGCIPREPILHRRIALVMLVFSLASVTLFALASSAVMYGKFESQEQQQLAGRTESLASVLNKSSSDQETRIDILSNQAIDELRITYISPDGEVLFDTSGEEITENHATRPEVQDAHKQGEAVIARFSDTLKTDLLYTAIALDDGSTIRLAMVRQSYLSFLASVAFPIVGLLIITALACLIVSRWLTTQIVRPIERIDVDNPLASSVYREMHPLLVRIEDQRTRLIEQNKALSFAENMRREFSANVSHEMKTPLTVISGYAELLEHDMIAPGDRKRVAGCISTEAQHMRALIDDVLIISHLEETATGLRVNTPIDLYEVVQDQVNRLTSSAEQSHIELRVSGEHATVAGHVLYCEQMVYNLLDNAIRYSPDGGVVHVRITERTEGNQDVVELSVADEGMGIPPEARDKIFERFYRVETSRSKETGGTGLGLAIVKHAVNYLNGSIEVHSRLGVGSTFVLTFPQSRERY